MDINKKTGPINFVKWRPDFCCQIFFEKCTVWYTFGVWPKTTLLLLT